MRPISCLLSLLALASAAQGQADYIAHEPLESAGFVKLWQLQLPLEAGQEVRDAYQVEDALYVATNDGHVYALHTDSGALRWMREVTTGGYRVTRPSHVGDRVVFVTTSQVTQYDRLSGEPIRRFNLRFPASSGNVSDGTHYYFGSLNRRFYSFDVQADFDTWKAGTNGSILSTPALFGEYLFVASDDGGVYACVAADKRFHWQTSTTGPNTADLVADERGVYVASRDRSLYSLNLVNGRVQWRTRLSGPLLVAPVVTPETAYQFESYDGLVAINTGLKDIEERVRWRLPRGLSMLTVLEAAAIVLTRDEAILVVDNQSGAVTAEISAPGFNLCVPRPTERSILLVSRDGRIFNAKPKGAPLVTRSDLRKAIYGADATATTSTRPATTRPSAPPAADSSRAAPQGPPVGGKSKVSRDYGRGSSPGAGEKP